jgi:predicted RNase H-like HicB family nuclease
MGAKNSDTYRVIIIREDGHWLADVPSLHGCSYLRS